MKTQKQIKFLPIDMVSLLIGISTFMGYLMPKSSL